MTSTFPSRQHVWDPSSPSISMAGGSWQAFPESVSDGFTDLHPLRDRKLFAIIDFDNLSISAERQFNAAIRYRELEERLYQITGRLHCLAVMTSPVTNDERAQGLRRWNWQVLDIKREVIHDGGVREVKSNADWDICFEAGRLFQTQRFDAILVGSGDGDLVLGIARGIKRISSASLYTLSIRATTSRRILLDHSPNLITGNFFVERDLLRIRKQQLSTMKRTA